MITKTIPFIHPVDPCSFTPTNITLPPATTGATTRAAAAAGAAGATAATVTTTLAPNAAKLAQQKATCDESLRFFLEVNSI